MQPAGALALKSNLTARKPLFPTKLEQGREITHAVCPSLTLGSSNTDTRWSLALTHVLNSGAPPNTRACTQLPAHLPAHAAAVRYRPCPSDFHPCF